MGAIEFVVLGLATWRIASLVTSEDGPFFIFKKAREIAGIVHDDNGEILVIPERFFALLLSCVWCFSVWCGIAISCLWFAYPQIAFAVSMPFAMSASAIIIHRNAAT